MRLFEREKSRWPRLAGKAVLEYDGHTIVPRREKGTIIIPERGETEIFKLKQDWSQLLIASPGQGIWFGGTDENPFLVQLNGGVYNQFLRSPRDFYTSLVPGLMNTLVKMFPKVSYSRQGDIFYFPLPYSWGEIEKAVNVCYWRTLDLSNKKKGEFSLFDTRHILKGLSLALDTNILGGKVNMLVEGTLVAPDHSSRVLEGPHAIAQTSNLFSPTEAD